MQRKSPLFSMKDVLDGDLDSDTCQMLLKQIKSPLMEQSFCLSTDDQRVHQASHTPRRPNIPPRRHNKQHGPSPCSTHPNPGISPFPANRHSATVHSNPFDSRANLQVFQSRDFKAPPSPYQNEHQASFTMNNYTTEMYDEQKPIKPQSHCCGSFNFIKEKEAEVQTAPFKISKRKPIFQTYKGILDISLQKSSYEPSRLPSNRSHTSNVVRLTEALKRLEIIKAKQIHRFLLFLRKLTEELRKTAPHKQTLQRNIGTLHRKMAERSTYLPIGMKNEETRRIMHRLKASTCFEAINKVTKQQFEHQTAAQQNLENLFSIYKESERVINQYVSSGPVQDLKDVYHLLEQGFQSQRCLGQQLIAFLHSLSVYEMDEEIELLEYIWPQLRRKRLTEGDFIEGICRNDVIVRDTRQECYQQELKSRGYSRNA